MKVCKNCGEKYGNEATFCNVCNVDLTQCNSKVQEGKLSDNDMLVLGTAKNNIVKAHNVLAFIQILFVVFCIYSAFSGEINLRALSLALIGSTFPVVHLCVARGIKNNKAWAHTVSIVLGILMFFVFPVGTLLGFVMIRNVLRKEWKLIELT